MSDIPDISWCKKGGSRGWITIETVEWDIGKNKSGWVFSIPPGREFESSVPPLLRWVFDPDDPFFLKSALIHDTLLELGFRRAFADSQWFEAALSVHAHPLRTWLAYSGMRLRRFIRWILGKDTINRG